MIDDYLNQSVDWLKKTGVNDYNEPEFGDPVAIACRFEYKRQLARNKEGQEVVSEARVFTTDAVKPDDIIRYGGANWPVITVGDQPGFDGDVVFYEVSL